MSDIRPTNCRFRLCDEGKPYPRSSCEACGKGVLTGLGTSCSQMPSYTGLKAKILSLRQQVEKARAQGRDEGLEEAAILVGENQEVTNLRTNKRSIEERTGGNLAGTAFIAAIRALKSGEGV